MSSAVSTVVESFGPAGQSGSVEIDAHGFVNATRLCSSGGKAWSGYVRNGGTEAYISALGSSLQKCRADLIRQDPHGAITNRHTWVHQRVAIHLANWISPEFAVWVTDIVQRHLHQLAAPLPPTPVAALLESRTGFQDWTRPQFYLSQIKGDRWDHLKYTDGGHQLLAPDDRQSIFVLKFGHMGEGARQTIREFGGDYRLLDSFPTPCGVTVEARVKGWLRARGMLMEGRHSHRECRDVELIGLGGEEVYGEVVDAVKSIIAEVEADMRRELDLKLASEPLEVQLERVKQEAETQRHLAEVEARRHREEQRTARCAERQLTKRLRLDRALVQPVTEADSGTLESATAQASVATTEPMPAQQPAQQPLVEERPGPTDRFVTFNILKVREDYMPVRQYYLDGTLAGEYPTAAEAAKAHPKFHQTDIAKCVNGERDLHLGYRWVAVPLAERETVAVTVPYNETGPIVQRAPGGAFVNSYTAISAAAKAVRVHLPRIRTAIEDATPCQLYMWSKVQ